MILSLKCCQQTINVTQNEVENVFHAIKRFACVLCCCQIFAYYANYKCEYVYWILIFKWTSECKWLV